MIPQDARFNSALPVRLAKVCCDIGHCGTIFAGFKQCPRCGSRSWMWLAETPGFRDCEDGDTHWPDDFFRTGKPPWGKRLTQWLSKLVE